MYVTQPSQLFDPPCSSPVSPKISNKTALRMRAGKHLFHEGDEASRLYQIKDGVLRLTRLTKDGRRQVIAFGFPGDIVGFPSKGRHHTDCETLTNTSVVSYSVSMLESGDRDLDTHRMLLQAALLEISAMQDHFLMLGRKSAAEKVASFLCVLEERIGIRIGQFIKFHLPMSRADIADFLGLTTETISRTLTQLRKSKVIAIKNVQTVIILKPDALIGLAESTN